MLLRATQRNQRSTDDTQLTGVPAQDRSVDWISQYQTQDTQWKGTVGWRQGLASFTAFRLDGLLGQTGPLGTELSAGRNQPANETPQLRIGGVKDLVSVGGNWRLSQREYVRARVEGDRFYGQADYIDRGPGVTYEATRWLYDRGVRVMGIDAWGWDRPLRMEAADALAHDQTGIFWAAHQADLDYSQIERLVNLDQLPASGFTVACFPLRIRRASAAPARVVAILTD
jgi:hypothetical protein